MKKKDERIKKTNEMFNNIRFIKMAALENFFLDKLDTARADELKLLRKNLLRATLSIFFNWFSPTMFLFVMFFSYSVWLK
jgi:ATP-binding cassette, subfamily C (CFTR/MRP), member 1